MSTFVVPRLHSLKPLTSGESLWDIALPLQMGKVHERTRVLSLGAQVDDSARDVTPLVDLDVPAQSLVPSKPSEGDWQRSQHRLGPFTKEFIPSNFPALKCKATRLHAQASHEADEDRMFFSGRGWIGQGTGLQLEAGELPVELKDGTYFHDVFAPLLAEGALELRLLPSAIAFQAKRLPLWTEGPHALENVSVWLEYGPEQGLWLRLDPHAPLPQDELLAAQCALLEKLLANSTEEPHWSAVRATTRIEARHLRWPVRADAGALRLEQPDGGGVRIDLIPGRMHVVLQDQRRGGAIPPLSSAQLEVERMQALLTSTGATLTLGAGATAAAAAFRYAYKAASAVASPSTESLRAVAPVSFRAPRGLGARLSDIRSEPKPLRRVFLALEHGWLQVPVERLDPPEQVAREATAEGGETESVAGSDQRVGGLTGEWQLGTRRSEFVTESSVVQMPWSICLRHASGFSGTWTYAAAAAGWALETAAVDLFGTQAEVRGLLWAAVSQETDEDFLPQLGLGSRHLRDLILLQGSQADCASLALQSDLVVQRQESGWPTLVPASFGLQWAPSVKPTGHAEAVVCWSAHPRLPAMLVMPVTSNRASPQRPLASRELQPLILAETELTFTHLPARPWPTLAATALQVPGGWPPPAFAAPAPEDPVIAWDGPRPHDGLPLVALSVAGVELWPGARSDTPLFAYRCDLPVMDEFFARARPSQPPRQRPAAVPKMVSDSAAADSEVVADLAVASTQDVSRHFVSHHDAWCLSRGEGVELRSLAGPMIRHHLLGGWNWARGDIQLTDTIQIDWAGTDAPTRFGSVRVTDAAAGAHPPFVWEASGDKALVGPSGGVALSGSTVALIAEGDGLIGWSVSAFEHGGMTWDTRGMGRGRAHRGGELHTRAWQGRDATFVAKNLELKTLIAPLRLTVGRVGGPAWLVWFRELPFENAVFAPASSSAAWAPVLDGFEWRVWPEGTDAADWSLEPRELLAVTCLADHVQTIRLRAGVGLPQRQGAGAVSAEVELTFERTGDVLTLAGADNGWFELPLPTIASTHAATPLLRARLDYDPATRDLLLREVVLSIGLLGAPRDLIRDGSVPLAVPQVVEFKSLDFGTVKGDSGGLRELKLTIGRQPADDAFALALQLQAAPVGQVELTQRWTSTGSEQAVVRHWSWLDAWPTHTLTPELDLRQHAGFCIAGTRKWDGDLVLLPHWKLAQPTAAITLACAIGEDRSAPQLHSAIVEMTLASDAAHVSQHSVLSANGWTHRVRVSGEWSLPSLHQWPTVTRTSKRTTLAAPLATQLTRLRFEGTELTPSVLSVRLGLGFHLELNQDVFLRARIAFTRAGATKDVEVLSPFWVGPLKSLIAQLKRQGARKTLGLKSGNRDNLMAALSSTAAGPIAAAVVAELQQWATQNELDDALCVVGSCVASVEVDKAKTATAVLPTFWIEGAEAALPPTLARMLRPQGTLSSALGFDDLSAAAKRGEPAELMALTSGQPVVDSNPAPIWEVRRDPPAATHAVVKDLLTAPDFFASAQAETWEFTHTEKAFTPVWIRSCPTVDLLLSTAGEITAQSWVARQSKGRVVWYSVDAARGLAPAEQLSALALSVPQHDLILLGSYGVAHYADFGNSGVDDPLSGARYLAAASLGCVGALATAYRRTLSGDIVIYTPCFVLVDARNDFRGAKRRPTTPVEATRGWSHAPTDDVLVEVQMDTYHLIARQGWQQHGAGVSGTQQVLRAPRAARALSTGGPWWDAHEEQVAFAAPRPALCDSLEGKAWWPARERIATTMNLMTTLALVHGSETDVSLQSVQSGWTELHQIGARPGVSRGSADRRIVPNDGAVSTPWGAAPADVAASLLQQYRAPRPVALPVNEGHVDHDRRPRAGIAHLRAESCSYYAGAADMLDLIDGLVVVVRLHAPHNAILGPAWDGRIELRFDFRGSPMPADFASRFCQSVCLTRLTFGSTELRLVAKPSVISPTHPAGVAVEIRVQAKELESLRWPTWDEAVGELTVEVTRDLRACPISQDAGEPADARPRAEPFTVLRFPMLLQSARRYPTPLQQCTVLFEDATYNAELGSEVASVEQRRGDVVLRPIITDRRAYHYNGSLTALFSPDLDGNQPRTVTFSRLRLDAAEGKIERRELRCINLQTGLACSKPTASVGSSTDKPYRWELAQLRVDEKDPPALQAHDVLAITLSFEATTNAVELQLPITDVEPIAPPQSAFALWYLLPAADVQRVRVPLAAWSPMPDRVELVDPKNDLKAGRVRRRALFRWSWVIPMVDQASRPWAFVQKIDHTGAAHTPTQAAELVQLVAHGSIWQ